MKKVLIFHPTIAPYRIDFFNDLYKTFDSTISLYYKNLKDQKFQYEEISSKFVFEPDYFEKSIHILKRDIPVGFIRRLKQKDSDVVIVNEYGESFWLTFLYRLIKNKKYKIITICDDSVDIFANEGGLHAIARKMALKHIDGIILCNDLVQNEYQKRYPNINTYVMPIIQEESRFFANKEAIIKHAKDIVLTEKLYGKRVFLYVGRISPEKNPLYLIKSFIKEHEKNSENILYIIGDYIPENKLYNDEIDKYIASHNACSYIKKIGRKEGDELKSWFYAGQVLVVPSVREPFGAVTNEALLCGNYVMISSIAGSTCLIDDSNGEIIDVNKESISFDHINKRVPLMTEQYLDSKENKMKYSYKNYIEPLIDWIDKL